MFSLDGKFELFQTRIAATVSNCPFGHNLGINYRPLNECFVLSIPSSTLILERDQEEHLSWKLSTFEKL